MSNFLHIPSFFWALSRDCGMLWGSCSKGQFFYIGLKMRPFGGKSIAFLWICHKYTYPEYFLHFITVELQTMLDLDFTYSSSSQKSAPKRQQRNTK